MKQLDLEPKGVRRVQHYPRFFFIYVPVVAIAWITFSLYAIGWDWKTALSFVMPSVALGAALGIKFRDAP